MKLWRRIMRKLHWPRALLLWRTRIPTKVRRGLVMIQIDGLSRSQFEHALRSRRLPFLRHLLEQEDYRVISHYSGLPSSTPSVQGELFYGAHTAVPSFGFRDHETKRLTSMFSLQTAGKVEERISHSGTALLEGGSSYGNVYSGGAQHARFCLSRSGRDGRFSSFRPLSILRVALTYAALFPRMAVLIGAEIVLAVVDFFRGVIARENFVKELKFVPSRVGLCILLRELIKTHVLLDIAEGSPVIHANFIGYDEQSHRRGPSSAFAHWTLKGIDAAIAAIWHSAAWSRLRDYDVWVYSDHGQEAVVPYERTHSSDVRALVDRIARNLGLEGVCLEKGPLQGMQLRRTVVLKHARRERDEADAGDAAAGDTCALLTGLGPVTHIYFTKELERLRREQFAEHLVADGGVPMVLTADGDGTAAAWTRAGRFELPSQAESLLGQHPFLSELRYDMVRLAHHPDAGELIMMGWVAGESAVTFPAENGSHAGVGLDETHGFALVPGACELGKSSQSYVRPHDIREAALVTLGRKRTVRIRHPASRGRSEGCIRVMTYNVHSCVGHDGNVSPQRIARVISRYDPDMVALQETDSGMSRTGGEEQAKTIAHALDMAYHFHPSFMLKEGGFGNAVLSRLPMRVVKAEALPGDGRAESRGALWVTVDAGRSSLQVIVTHMSFYPTERRRQVQALIDKDWIGSMEYQDNLVVCGDFNMLPRSISNSDMTRVLRDVHAVYSRTNGTAASRTWMGLACLDYVFVGPGLDVQKVLVPRTQLTRIASDHLPVIVDLHPDERISTLQTGEG